MRSERCASDETSLDRENLFGCIVMGLDVVPEQPGRFAQASEPVA